LASGTSALAPHALKVCGSRQRTVIGGSPDAVTIVFLRLPQEIFDVFLTSCAISPSNASMARRKLRNPKIGGECRSDIAEVPFTPARSDSSPGAIPRIWTAGVIVLLVIIFAFSAGRRFPFSQKDTSTMDGNNAVHESLVKSLDAPEIPETADLALLNLLCDPSLERDEIAKYLLMVDAMAEAVRKETEREQARYISKPTEYSSEVEWRLCMLSTVLGQDFNVKYDPKLSSPEMLESPINVFFAEPRKVFITGCLGPERVGTCSSLPVLYVAVGRRLGYPLHLVATKGHLFARWDDGAGTMMNMEAANSGGFTTHSDDHYRNWPRRVSKEEEIARGYLKNLSTNEAFANFLSIRSAVLQAAGNLPESAFAAASAYRLAPNLGGDT
jgi:hypothetical protein